MECHYDVLELPKDATAEDLKKSYRKLILQWHPDKNPENADECKTRFQLIQQAYEVLNDPQERAWYDKHRDEILKGGVNNNYKDESLDVFQYFNASCYSGYNDNEKGFYTVFRDVFATIAEEDKAFLEEDEDETSFPSFGTSADSYDEVVHRFYGFWQSYCTAKSYIWIAKYDIQEAPNRRVLRLMEKENKKLRDLARKRRNEEIRELVAFVRKRDKRVLAHKKELEAKAAENAKRNEDYRKKMIQERKESLANSKVTEWISMADLEDNLKVIEKQLDRDEQGSGDGDGDGDDDSDSQEELVDESLYCIACDKLFRSEKAKLNHDNSKKHLENLAYLKAVMQQEEDQLDDEANRDADRDEDDAKDDNDDDEIDLDEESLNVASDSDSEDDLQQLAAAKSRKKKKKRKGLIVEHVVSSTEINKPLEISSAEEDGSRLSRGEAAPVPPVPLSSTSDTPLGAGVGGGRQEEEDIKIEKKKKSRRKDKTQIAAANLETEVTAKSSFPDDDTPLLKDVTLNICESCGKDFPTRNKLFTHLKSTGHQQVLGLGSSASVSATSKNLLKKMADFSDDKKSKVKRKTNKRQI